jgi:hypothetical protein
MAKVDLTVPLPLIPAARSPPPVAEIPGAQIAIVVPIRYNMR